MVKVRENNSIGLITHVDVTDACSSDVHAVIPTLDDLTQLDLQPAELQVDTTYASADNAIGAASRGTELIGPTGG
jgi:hypothetical protein